MRSVHSHEDWKGLGRRLDLHHADLERIDKSNGGNLAKCKTALIHHWLHSGRATKTALLDAINVLEESSIASSFGQEI